MNPAAAVALLTLAACAPRLATQRTTYPGGATRSEVATRNGVPDGDAVYYREDGTVEVRGTYRRGHKHGTWTHVEPGGGERVEHYDHGARVDAAPPPTRAVERTPAAGRFATLDRFDGEERIELRAGLHTLATDDGQSSGRSVAVYAQLARGRYGGYLELRGASSSGALEGGFTPASPELGGFVALPRGLAARVGLTAPIGEPDLALPLIVTHWERLTDLAVTAPGAAALRASGSWSGRRGMWRWRADAGLDALRHRRFASAPDADRYELLGRANFGVAAELAPAFVTLELANVAHLTADSGDGSAAAHAAAISARWLHHTWQPSIAVVVPLDGSVRGEAVVVSLALELTNFTP